MKLKTNNFSGKINFEYKIEVESNIVKGQNQVWVLMKVKLDNIWNPLAAAGGELHANYNDALRSSLLRAEDKYGIDLLSIDIDNLKSA